MDDTRFDQLARLLGRARTRRSMIKAIAGGLFAGAAVARVESPVAARTCSKNGLTCRENANCCSGVCGPKDRTGRRTCGCPANLTNCNPDGCVDLKTDPQHCGACGNVAETDRAQTCCNGTVTQLGTPDNCSTCGDNCANQGSGFGCFPTSDGFQCRAPNICVEPSVTVSTSNVITPVPVLVSSISSITTSLTDFIPVSSSLTIVTPVVSSSISVVGSICDSLSFSASCLISTSFSETTSLTQVVPVPSSITVVTPVVSSILVSNTITTSLTEVVSSSLTVTSSLTC